MGNEVVRVIWDPKKISFADILRQFWTSHDPTQGMGQGNDRGTHYRSGIYTTTDTQYQLAVASLSAYQESLKAAGKAKASGHGQITSEIIHPKDEPKVYYAEDYHQQY